MFNQYLIILDFKIIKYRKNIYIPLEDLYWDKKIKYRDFFNNPIYKNYFLLLKYYSYLLRYGV